VTPVCHALEVETCRVEVPAAADVGLQDAQEPLVLLPRGRAYPQARAISRFGHDLPDCRCPAFGVGIEQLVGPERDQHHLRVVTVDGIAQAVVARPGQGARRGDADDLVAALVAGEHLAQVVAHERHHGIADV